MTFNTKIAVALLGLLLFAAVSCAEDRPNVLFAIADDWGWPHASAYGDAVVKTPNFDRLAKEGVLFHHAYVSSPSCTPSRGAILTGQWHWRLEGAANLWSVFPDKLATYSEILEKAGYETGHSGKAWGPGKTESSGRPLAGKRYANFAAFLKARDKSKPFCYWLGTSDPHRPFKKGAGKASGMDLAKVEVPGFFPDSPEVRGDIADYYFEVQRFDALVGSAMAELERLGELDNTIIAMTGDHGMPFPRCKSNLYDSGTRVPLAIRWPAKAKGGRETEEFVSLCDLAPTFLNAAGVKVPTDMTGRSLLPILLDQERDLSERDHVLVGKERHVPSQEKPDMGGYPCRGIRTHKFFYIQNLKPERWPNGTPDYANAAMAGNWLGDTDNGPTKTYIADNKDKDDLHRKMYTLSFAKRPADELFDLEKDPEQLHNVADDPAYAEVKEKLTKRLTAQLKATGDPRIVGGVDFDAFPYLGGGPKHPDWGKRRN